MCAYCDRLSACPSLSLRLSLCYPARFFCLLNYLLPRFFNFCYIFLLRFSFSRSFFFFFCSFLLYFYCLLLCLGLCCLPAVPFPFPFRFLPWKIKSIVILPATSRFVPLPFPLPFPLPGIGPSPGWASALCRRVDVPVLLIVLAAFKSHKRLLLLSFYCFLYVFLWCLFPSHSLCLSFPSCSLLDSFIIGNQWSIRIFTASSCHVAVRTVKPAQGGNDIARKYSPTLYSKNGSLQVSPPPP